jgi:hypothetical protein
MSLDNSNMGPADIAAITGNGSNAWGNNNGWEWIIILFLFAFMNNGWGNGYAQGNAPAFNGAVPYVLNASTNGDVQRGFDQSAVMSSLNGISSAITNGFSDAAVSQCNQTTTLLNSLANGQMNTMQGFNAVQGQVANTGFDTITAMNNGFNSMSAQMMTNEMARQNCCCETKQAIGDLKYTVATENCADRAALSDGLRDIIANNTANTNALLQGQSQGFQRILDQLCADKIEAKNDTIAQLRAELNEANRLASQTAQTGQILANNAAQTAALEQYLRPCPSPAYIVPNPNCCTQQNGCGCGCGMA